MEFYIHKQNILYLLLSNAFFLTSCIISFDKQGLFRDNSLELFTYSNYSTMHISVTRLLVRLSVVSTVCCIGRGRGRCHGESIGPVFVCLWGWREEGRFCASLLSNPSVSSVHTSYMSDCLMS